MEDSCEEGFMCEINWIIVNVGQDQRKFPFEAYCKKDILGIDHETDRVPGDLCESDDHCHSNIC